MKNINATTIASDEAMRNDRSKSTDTMTALAVAAKKVLPNGRPAAQGDVMFRRVKALPPNATAKPGSEHVVAHSETGHHHVALGGRYYTTPDPFIAYLVTTAPVVVEHRRSTDTHESIELLADGGEVVWEIRRQREYTPEGWRRVED